MSATRYPYDDGRAVSRVDHDDDLVVMIPMVSADFDIRKTIAAVAFLVEKEGGDLDMFLGLKMLYLADKRALIMWGKTITGDSLVSMPKGPVLSATYNLFKGSAPREDQIAWDGCFSERVNQSIHLVKDVDTGILSEREMEVLEAARGEINGVAPWEVSLWLHQICPEWTDPQGSSIPIDPSTILRNAGKTQEEIERIETSVRAYNHARRLLGNPLRF